MNEPEVTVNRILVALDASPLGADALETAAELAAHLQAELAGLFIEDVNLLRLASLPFAQEICSPSGVQRPLDVPSMERALHALAARLRESLAATAQRAQVRWTFEIKRGPTARATRDAADTADLLVLGRSTIASPVVGRRTAMTRPIRPILVLFDGAPSGEQAILAGLCLSRQRGAEMVVAVVPDASHPAAELREAARRLVASLGGRGTFPPNVIANASQLLAYERANPCSLVLLSRDSHLLNGATIESLVNDLDCPLGFVR